MAQSFEQYQRRRLISSYFSVVFSIFLVLFLLGALGLFVINSEKISNDLCSLNPNTKKLTLTCEMIIDNFWKIIETSVYNSIISSDFRLTYKEVDEILLWKILIWNELLFWWKINEKLIFEKRKKISKIT